jgi:phosphate:Na+ symporter
LLAIGVGMFLGARDDKRRSLARIAIGLGLTLLALRLIGSASTELRQSPGLVTTIALLESQPLVAMIVAAILTWLAHSSLSSVILVVSLTSSGTISLPLGIALALGANVGGCLAPYIDQIAAPVAARRVALGNLIMRGSLAVVAFLCLPLAARALQPLDAISPGHAVLAYHVAFNVITAAVFLWFVDHVARLCRQILPDVPVSGDPGEPRYLDANLIDSPTEALACATRETLALGDLVSTMLDQSLAVLERDDARLVRQIGKSDDAVDRLHEAIKLYLMRLSSAGMSEEDGRRFLEILTFVTNLEHIGDIIDKNLMELAAKKIKHKLAFSPEGLAELRQFHGRVSDNMRLAFNVFTLRDVRLARKLLAEKPLLREAEIYSTNSHFARLRAGVSQSLETSAIHLDIIRDLKRINSHLTSVAYPILEAAGELLDTRLRKFDVAGEARQADRN